MSFLKVGAPQPIHIASTLCEVCGNNQSTVLIDGKMLCADCQQQIANSQQTKE